MLSQCVSQYREMPRGFMVKRLSVPGHDAALSAFHPVPFNPVPLHLLVERLRFDPRLCFYSEPLTLSTPLDLSLKSNTPITPPATPTPLTPPSRKRSIELVTPATPQDDPSSKKAWSKTPLKKNKAVRKLSFDEDNTSPVSGTIIRQLRDDEPPLVVRKGDIDPAYNVVEVTEEAKAELAKIENRIGDYICRLCKELYEDAFSLAQHRCSRIVHVEYRCPECDKIFNCPANLASHRRWHKPRMQPSKESFSSEEGDSTSEHGDAPYVPCPVCNKMFRRQAYLRKHMTVHQSETLSQVLGESHNNLNSSPTSHFQSSH